MTSVQNRPPQLNGNNEFQWYDFWLAELKFERRMQKMWKGFLIIIVCLVNHFAALAQPGEVEVRERDGKSFYIHVVQAGNTLWGLQTLYKVPAEEIIQDNPGAENKLDIGQLVWIPVTEANAVKTEPVYHTVEKGQTLYGIAQRYKTSVDELLRLNPSANNGISTGQKLLVKGEVIVSPAVSDTPKPADPVKPATKVIFKDSLVEHTVLPHETLYSISKRFMVPVDTIVKRNNIQNNKIRTGDVLLIPLKKEEKKTVPVREVPAQPEPKKNETEFIFQQRDEFHIAVLLPMNYDQNGQIYSGSPTAVMNRYTKAATEFYMGIKYALDSLGSLGFKAKVKLFDTQADSAATVRVLKSMEGQRWDLIIGPLMPGPSKAVVAWARNQRVPVLLPVPTPMSNLKGNPYVYSSVPSDNRLLEGMADELAKNHAKNNIILVNSGIKSDEGNYSLVRKRINDQLGAGAYRSSLKEINLGSTTGKDIAAFIETGMVNVFVVPSTNRVFAANFMTTMNKVRNMGKQYDEADIRVYALKEWDSFDEIKLDYKRRLNLHYPSAINLDYDLHKIQQFIASFRLRYKTDPDKYAMQGFDATMHFIKKYLLKQNNPGEGVINNLHYSTLGEGNGYENNNVFVIRYNNFSLQEAGRAFK
jgi:LysM repeat protein